MTETLSHIALRRLNGPEASDWYTPFESIQIRLSKENTLVIYAPEICEKELVTNDIAEINGQVFFQCGLYLFYLHFYSSCIDRVVFSA